MKKIIALLLIIFCSFNIAAGEEIKLTNILQNVNNSVFKVFSENFNSGMSSGTGFVIKHTSDETIIVTAGHIFDRGSDSSNTVNHVLINSKKYISSSFYSYLEKDKVDAAILVFKPGIKEKLVALEFNLNPSSDIVECLAFGFALDISLDGEEQELTFTAGRVKRNVCGNFAYNLKLEQLQYVIHGTPTLQLGYSGGPLLDTNFRILGISISYGNNNSSFTDSRFLWNILCPIIKKQPVFINVDDTFDIFNLKNEKRLEAKDSIEIISANKITTLLKARELLNKDLETRLFDYSWINYNSKIKINGSVFNIYRVEILSRNSPGLVEINNNVIKDEELHYIYLSEDGWRLLIHLDIVKE
jgi:hypothetical protein